MEVPSGSEQSLARMKKSEQCQCAAVARGAKERLPQATITNEEPPDLSVAVQAVPSHSLDRKWWVCMGIGP